MRLDISGSEAHPMLGELIEARSFDSTTGIYECGSCFALLFEMAPMVGIADDQITTLNAMFEEMELGKGFVQIINWASPAIEPVLARWQDGQAEAQPMRIAGRLALFRQAAKVERYPNSNWRQRHYRVFLAVLIPSSGRANRIIERLQKIKVTVGRTLEAIGSGSIIVRPAGLLALYQELLAPDLGSTAPARADYCAEEPIDEQLFMPGHGLMVDYGGIITTRDRDRDRDSDRNSNSDQNTASDQDRRSRIGCFSVMRTPENWGPGEAHKLIGDIFHSHNNCPWPILQSVTIRHEEANTDNIRMRNNTKNKQARGPLRFLDPKLETEALDWDFVTREIETGATLVRVLYQIVLFARTKEAPAAEAALRNLFENQGFKLRRENGFHLPALMTALPLGVNTKRFDLMQRQRRTRRILRRNALTLAPIFGEWQGNDLASPAIMLFTGRRGQPAGWTPWASNGAFNCAIGGKTGAGKSVFMQEMVCGIHATGGASIVIDKGESFINSCALLGGSYITFDDPDLRFNPFAIVDARAMRDARGEYGPRAMSMLAAFCGGLASPKEPLSQLQHSILVNAVSSVWQDKGNDAHIDDVLTRLEGGDHEEAYDLWTLLKPCASDGPYGTKLAGGCNIDISNPLVVFELKSLSEMPELRAGVMVILGFLATEKMYRSPRDHRVGLIIDEAHDLLSGSSAGFVEEVARTARKYNGALVTATQSIEDYFRNPSAEIAWNQSDWRILLQQSESSIAALETNKRITVDARLKHALTSLQPRRDMWSEMIIHGPFGWDITRLLIDEFTLSSMTTSGSDVAAINKLMAEGLNRGDAIREFAKRQQAETRQSETAGKAA